MTSKYLLRLQQVFSLGNRRAQYRVQMMCVSIALTAAV